MYFIVYSYKNKKFRVETSDYQRKPKEQIVYESESQAKCLETVNKWNKHGVLYSEPYVVIFDGNTHYIACYTEQVYENESVVYKGSKKECLEFLDTKNIVS
jgi:hypothetical protein